MTVYNNEEPVGYSFAKKFLEASPVVGAGTVAPEGDQRLHIS
jgi:hypothetical protein